MQLPTEDDMKQKIKDFQEAKNFEFTDEHVEHVRTDTCTRVHTFGVCS